MIIPEYEFFVFCKVFKTLIKRIRTSIIAYIDKEVLTISIEYFCLFRKYFCP